MWIITVISVKAGAVALSNPGSKLRRSLLLLRSGSHLPYLPPGFFFFFLLPRDTRASLFLCHFGLYKSPAVITGLLLIGSTLLAVRLMKPDALRSLPAANGNDGNNIQSQSLFLAFFCHVVGWNGACFGVLGYWDGIGMVDLCTCLLKIMITISSKFSFAFKFETQREDQTPRVQDGSPFNSSKCISTFFNDWKTRREQKINNRKTCYESYFKLQSSCQQCKTHL